MLFRSSKIVILGRKYLLMTTLFRAVSWGFDYTDAFFGISIIKAYMQSFQKDIEVDSTTKIHESIANSAQNAMEREIAQHIRISDKLAKEELFDYLTGWANYFEYILNNPQLVKEKIEKYNEKRGIEYQSLIDEEESKFKNTNKYKTLNHLEFYEEDYGVGLSLFHSSHNLPIPKKRLVQYRKFFEAPDPDLIDVSFLEQYLEFINPIITRCITIARNRLSYLKGENELKQLPSSEAKSTKPLVADIATDRLKVSINVEELAVLLRLLHKCDVIISNKKEIHNFVADHIQTVGMSNKRISPQNFGKLFSSKDSKIATFWISRLALMIKDLEKK